MASVFDIPIDPDDDDVFVAPPLLALPAPRMRFVRPALVTPAVIYLSGPAAPPLQSYLCPKIQQAGLTLISDLGSRLGSPLVISEIDKAISVVAKLREMAAELHGINKPPPWR